MASDDIELRTRVVGETGLTLKTGRLTRITVVRLRLVYADDGLPSEPLAAGRVHVLSAEGQIQQSLTVDSHGNCTRPLKAPPGASPLRLVVEDREDCSPEERSDLLRYGVQEVALQDVIELKSPLCYELWWSGPRAQDVSPTGPDRQHAGTATLVLSSLDGAYRSTRSVPVQPGKDVRVRFFGVRPGLRYSLTWESDGVQLPMLEDSDLGL